MDKFAGSSTSLIADVDCTTDGKDLCEKHGVRGYPTIKYGDPNDLQDYNGGRSYADLEKFATENLGPTCGPDYLDLCDEKQKKSIAKFQALGEEELEAKIKKAQEVVKVDVPLMQKVIGHLKKSGKEL